MTACTLLHSARADSTSCSIRFKELLHRRCSSSYRERAREIETDRQREREGRLEKTGLSRYMEPVLGFELVFARRKYLDKGRSRDLSFDKSQQGDLLDR